MSNMTQTWNSVYDRQRAARLQQRAVDGMRAIRQQLIGLSVNPAQQQIGLAAAAAAAARSGSTPHLASAATLGLSVETALATDAAATALATDADNAASYEGSALENHDCFSDSDSSSDEDDEDLPQSERSHQRSGLADIASAAHRHQPLVHDLNPQPGRQHPQQQKEQQQQASQPDQVGPAAASSSYQQLRQRGHSVALAGGQPLLAPALAALKFTQGMLLAHNTQHLSATHSREMQACDMTRLCILCGSL